MNESSISSISVDVTYRCNLRCKHCFNSSGENLIKEELDDNEFVSLIKEIAIMEIESVCFCGGEPIIRFDCLEKAVKNVREFNDTINLNMVSNGTLLDESIADRIKKAGFSFIQISLDGATQDTYEWLRGKAGTWELAVNAIKLLCEREMNVGVAFAPSKVNINEISHAIDLCESLGVSQFRIQPMMYLGRARNIQDSFLTHEEYFSLVNKLKLESYNRKMIIEWGDPIQHMIYARNNNKTLEYFNISANGDIGVTPYLPICFGNIKSHSITEYINAGLLEVWNNLEIMKIISDGINSAYNMDVSMNNEKLPEIYTDHALKLDLIEDDVMKKDAELVEKYGRGDQS